MSSVEEINQRITKIRWRMISKCPFLGSLLLKLKIIVKDDLDFPAAVTPDGTCRVSTEFCDRYSDAELGFILAHEVMHLALLAWQRKKGRNRVAIIVNGDGKQIPISLWNLAHDLSFNGILKEFAEQYQDVNESKTLLKMPDGLAFDQKLHGMSAEEIYDRLIQQAEDNTRNNGGNGVSPNAMSAPGIYIPSSDGVNVETGLNGNGDLLNDLGDGSDDQTHNQEFLDKQESVWKNNLVEAYVKHELSAKNKGTLPATLKRYVDEIIDAKIDWRNALLDWVGENGKLADYSYRRPSRRGIAINEYLPSSIKYGYDQICILIDTSGSMSHDELKSVIGEINGMCEDLGIVFRVIIIDSEIHNDLDQLDNVYDVIDNMSGGGGSNFIPAFTRLEEENYQGVVIAFTDGYIDVPSVPPPSLRGTLWVLTDQGVDPTDGAWGEVLQMV